MVQSKKTPKLLFLIGYRATGKTSVGKKLAEAIKWNFVDTDTLIVEKNGKSIKNIVDEKGWDYFRKEEGMVLKEVCSLKNSVVATGGGVVLLKENVDIMKKNGFIILLKAKFETIKSRIEKDDSSNQNRPPLKQALALDLEIKETLKKREPIYKSLSDISFSTDDLSVSEIVFKVLNLPSMRALHKHIFLRI